MEEFQDHIQKVFSEYGLDGALKEAAAYIEDLSTSELVAMLKKSSNDQAGRIIKVVIRNELNEFRITS